MEHGYWGGKFKSGMPGQAPIGQIAASLATMLVTTEIWMKCFAYCCLKLFCQFYGENSAFSTCFIILNNPKWYFKYFYRPRPCTNEKTHLKRLILSSNILNEWASRTWICPPKAVFPNFTLNAPSSVIYNLNVNPKDIILFYLMPDNFTPHKESSLILNC